MISKTNQQQVVDAAIEAFMGYGFQGETMGDLATAADMSKPWLYGLFPNKKTVFRAAVKQLLESMTNALPAATKEDAALLVRVQTLLDRWTLKRYRLMQKYPDIREFIVLSSGFVKRFYPRYHFDSHQKCEPMRGAALRLYAKQQARTKTRTYA